MEGNVNQTENLELQTVPENETEVEEVKEQKNPKLRLLLFFLFILLLTLSAGAIYYVIFQQKEESIVGEVTETPTKTETDNSATTEEEIKVLTFTHQNLPRFSFDYKENWEISTKEFKTVDVNYFSDERYIPQHEDSFSDFEELMGVRLVTLRS